MFKIKNQVMEGVGIKKWKQLTEKAMEYKRWQRNEFLVCICKFRAKVRCTGKLFFKHLLRNYNTYEANFLQEYIPWVVLSKICSYGYEILNIFRTGSEKPQKLAKSLKIFSSATGQQKTVLKSIRGSFSNSFEATSCVRYFFICFRECKGMKNHNLNAQ
jgi:hypothetical protein